MTDITEGRSLSRPRPRLRRLIQGPKARASGGPGSRSATAGAFVTLCWLGLLTGFLELALVAGQRAFVARISLESLRLNRAFIWMIPAAELLIFGLLGLVIASLERLRPGRGRTLIRYAGVGLSALALLLSVEVLAAIPSVILACGIMCRAQPLLRGRADLLSRAIRKTLPVLAGTLLCFMILSSYRSATAERRALGALPPAPKPAANVILLVMDNVRADSMSLYGCRRPTTPRLDQLAGDAIRFDAARPTSSWTLPSHASMFTGQWPHGLSVDWNRGLDRTHATLAEWLSGRGYATAGFVANTYYCNARYGLDRGFARYEDFRENQAVSLYETLRCASLGRGILRALGDSLNFAPGEEGSRKTADSINHDALGWLDHRPAGRPFFLFLNYYDAHSPFLPPADTSQRFGTCALPQGEQVEIPKRAARASADPGLSAAEKARLGEQADAIRLDGYESCIAYLDRKIGEFFDELRRRGLLENTLVIVTSDHGEHLQERGFSGHGLSLYRREVHVPLLIFPPSGATREGSVSEPVSLRDLPATVVDLLGLDGDSPFPGQSLARFWQSPGSTRPAADFVLSELGHQQTLAPHPSIPATLGSTRALTTDRAVLIRSSSGKVELYDRVLDPFEQTNLIDADPGAHPLARQKAELLEMLDAHGSRN
ncbi:MAG: sulfatase [Isosphaeraceae bacterium]